METSTIDKGKLRKTLWTSWGYTSLAFLNIAFITIVIAAISVRFGGPRLFIAAISPLLAFSIGMFLFSENIVNLMLRAKKPDPKNEKHALFVALVKKISKQVGLWGAPRTYIVNVRDLPNAVAYGTGLPFLRAVGITDALLEMMDEKEIEAVLAHEIGHIRSKDVGVMTFVGILFQILDKSTSLFLRGGSVFGRGPFAYIFGFAMRFLSRFVFGIMRSAISQEREFAADALAAQTQGTSRYMIAALEKLHAYREPQGELFGTDKFEKRSRDNPIEDLMVSHPGMGARIESLNNLSVA